MKKSLLVKYIVGDITPEERQSVLEWASESEANKLYLARLMNLHVSQNLPEEEASEEEVSKMMETISPKLGDSVRTKGKVFYSIRKGVFWSTAAAVAVIMVSLLWALYTRPDSSVTSPADTLLANVVKYPSATPQKSIYVPKGAKAHLLLPDSSQVWLNSDTKISYPDEFDSLYREVTISGEAYFKVMKNADRPMIVRTNKDFFIQVTGTEFNIRAYEDDTKSQTTLYNGEIFLNHQRNNKIVRTKVEPLQTVVIEGSTSVRSVKKFVKTDPEDDHAWKENRIIFDFTPMPEVIKLLERWHGVEFIVENKTVLDHKITATFNSESIVQIMELLQMTTRIKYRISDKRVFLY